MQLIYIEKTTSGYEAKFLNQTKPIRSKVLDNYFNRLLKKIEAIKK